MLIFANPGVFLFLLTAPLFFVLRRLGILRGAALPLTLSDWGGKSFVWERRLSALALWVCRSLTLAAFALAVTALAGPAIARQEKVYTSHGTEIIFVIDVSPSMAAQDMAGMTRLEAAKEAIRFLTQEQNGAAYGLALTASEAVLAAPPTLDTAAFAASLDALMVGALGDGSALGDGLSVAVWHLSSSSAPKKCAVLLTDGENNGGSIHPETAAALARSKGITIYAVGIGARGSAPISYSDPLTGAVYSGFLDSQFDEEALRRIAAEGGGNYFSVPSLDSLKTALASIAGREHTAQTWYYRRIEESCYVPLALTALMACVAAWLIRRVYLREVL
ncbi:MAG: VWA domain-containing protein [Treponema sp.]|nr:VWA domain-containing protein [Treponema sp.]